MNYDKFETHRCTTKHYYLWQKQDRCSDWEHLWSYSIIAKRASQINAEIKHELEEKLEEFAINNDSLEEVFENKEQIEVSKFYEKTS